MANKLTEIRETTSDAVSIIRELGSPGVQESLGKILETAKAAKEIVDTFKTPEFVKNVENIRRTAGSIQNSSIRIENVVTEMKQSGVFEQARETLKSANRTLGTVSDSRGIGEISDTLRATLNSITELVNELKAALETSRRDGAVGNVKAAIREFSDVYRNFSDSPQ
jgi:hypothetical protein